MRDTWTDSKNRRISKEDERRILSAWRSEPHERRSYWRSIEERSQ
jgi:hypothetical protein